MSGWFCCSLSFSLRRCSSYSSSWFDTRRKMGCCICSMVWFDCRRPPRINLFWCRVEEMAASTYRRLICNIKSSWGRRWYFLNKRNNKRGERIPVNPFKQRSNYNKGKKRNGKIPPAPSSIQINGWLKERYRILFQIPLSTHRVKDRWMRNSWNIEE